jgi:hypothetical protein
MICPEKEEAGTGPGGKNEVLVKLFGKNLVKY